VHSLADAPTIASPVAPDVAGTWVAVCDVRAGETAVRANRGPFAPVVAARHGLTCILDGDLDNAAELERQVGSDRPVPDPAALVLAGYEKWGADVFSHLRGRVAVVIWDAPRGRLLAARDRVGAIPLFFARAGDALLISSTVETLLAQPGIPPTLNRAAIADHLCHRWPSTEETHYSAINRVPAAHVLTWNGTSPSVSRYWSPVPAERPVAWVRDEEVDRFEELLDQAVTRCVRHGQAGVFLSGGFDSVSIAAMAVDRARHAGQPPPIGLSLAFPHPECNEETMQRSVGTRLGLQHVVLPFDQAAGPGGIVWSAVAMNEHAALPMMNPWRPAYRRLGEAGVAEGCRVAVNGGGGDEFLTVGPAYMADMFRSLNLLGAAQYIGNTMRSFSLHKRRLLQNLLWKYGLRSLAVAQGTRALKAVAPDVLRRRWRARLLQVSPAWLAPDPALRAELSDRVDLIVEQLLRRDDPSGRFGFYFRGLPDAFLHPMRSLDQEELYGSRRRIGLREMQPYWDSDLVEFLFRTPPRLLNRGGRTKGLVRYAVGRRFPGLGFERHRKISASNFFCEQVQAQGPSVWQRMGGVRALADLGIVDADSVNGWLARRVPDELQTETARVWETLSLEAWVRAHAG
jgi:asparagine synthetase B (glutamine-hydrolysing)